MGNIFPTNYDDKTTLVDGDKTWGYDSETPSNKNFSLLSIFNYIVGKITTTNVTEGTNKYVTDVNLDATTTITDIKSDITDLGTNKENVSNKSTDGTFASPNDTAYPTTLAVKTLTDNIGVPINAQTEETTIEDADEIIFYDDSAAGNKKITKQNLFISGIIAPKTLLATQDISSTTTLNIAHGLGRTPRFVRVYAIRNSGFQSVGTFDGTNNRATYPTSGSAFTNSTTYGVGIYDSASNGRLVGEISFDSTNVTFTWTKITSPTGTGYIQIEVI